ncbi:CBS domain-containing protein [Candidatus Pacearchaeota archaeon]|nr:CBS domain-containing protein [Candidatus Pacearchaeota archaeon]
MKVKEIMKQPFVTEKDLSLQEVAKIMSTKDIGSLIFTKNDEIKGIVTDSDLIKHFGSKAKMSQIMAKNVITIAPDENLDGALKLMKKKEIKRLPIIQDGKLVGIITMTDIMANAEELEEDFLLDN